ncbi:hypothetical protein [Streptomyces sp. SPB074]|uniref:hypothetical protein n=1 Tax=Streptomyces sp. (strain SPB074) TaxID=465543 RepID=UPI00017F181C|nr:hypothetical protein [Streptomyces sp. SPB074]
MPHSRSLMKVGGWSWLLRRSPLVAHCAYCPEGLTATTTPSEVREAAGARSASAERYREASAPRQEARILVTAGASMALVRVPVTVKACAAARGSGVAGAEDPAPGVVRGAAVPAGLASLSAPAAGRASAPPPYRPGP